MSKLDLLLAAFAVFALTATGCAGDSPEISGETENLISADIQGNFATARNFRTEQLAGGSVNYDPAYGYLDAYIDVDQPGASQFAMIALNVQLADFEGELTPGHYSLTSEGVEEGYGGGVSCSGNSEETRIENEDSIEDLELEVIDRGEMTELRFQGETASGGTVSGTLGIPF